MMGDFVLADTAFKDFSICDDFDLDLAYGKDENDFTLTVSLGRKIPYGTYAFYDESDWGGTVDSRERVGGKTKRLRYGGRTWQGILDRTFLCPDSGKDYLSYSGDLNDIIAFVIARQGKGDVFVASSEKSGVTVSGNFDRYVSAFAGLSKLCRAHGRKLSFRKISGGKVEVSAQVAVMHELDSDHYEFDIKESGRFVNHLVCLGSGDLKDRIVVHLYADANRKISQTQTFFGVDEVAEVYDYNNADRAELTAKGIEKLQEYLDSDTCELTVSEVMGYDIGDSVHAVNVDEGIEITATIEKVIVTADEEREEVSYEIGNIRMGG